MSIGQQVSRSHQLCKVQQPAIHKESTGLKLGHQKLLLSVTQAYLVSLCPLKLPVATYPPNNAGHAILLHLRYVMAWTATSGLARNTLVTTKGEENQMENARTTPPIHATHKPSAVTMEACGCGCGIDCD